MYRVNIISLRNNPTEYLAHLWKTTTESTEQEICLDFGTCNYLKQDSVVFIGGLTRLLQHQGKTVLYQLEGMGGWLRTNIEQNGFLGAFGLGGEGWQGNSIPFREDRKENKDGIIEYLRTHWFGRNWVNISEGLKDRIIGKVIEIYANSFQHSKSPIGVITCGQHFPKTKELYLSILDLGVGIPFNVRTFLKLPNFPADETIKWALIEGNSTRPSNLGPGGMGLGILKEFVKLNHGSLEIFSHDGHAYIDGTGDKINTLDTFFGGTLVNLKVQCDERRYRLASEADKSEPLF